MIGQRPKCPTDEIVIPGGEWRYPGGGTGLEVKVCTLNADPGGLTFTHSVEVTPAGVVSYDHHCRCLYPADVRYT